MVNKSVSHIIPKYQQMSWNSKVLSVIYPFARQSGLEGKLLVWVIIHNLTLYWVSQLHINQIPTTKKSVHCFQRWQPLVFLQGGNHISFPRYITRDIWFWSGTVKSHAFFHQFLEIFLRSCQHLNDREKNCRDNITCQSSGLLFICNQVIHKAPWG